MTTLHQEYVDSLVSVSLEKAKEDSEIVARFNEDPILEIIHKVLLQYISTINAQIPTAFTTQEIDIFGDAHNHIDPMLFHEIAKTSTSGSICVPQVCTKVLGIEICIPPVPICASGIASAGLNSLQGLSSMRILDCNITNVDTSKIASGLVSATATLSLHANNLTSRGFASAEGGPFGISIPVDASGSATVKGLQPSLVTTVTIDFHAPKVTALKIETFQVSYASIDIYIDGLGAFNVLIGPLLEGLKTIVQQFFNVDGVISDALKGVLQDQFNKLID